MIYSIELFFEIYTLHTLVTNAWVECAKTGTENKPYINLMALPLVLADLFLNLVC